MQDKREIRATISSLTKQLSDQNKLREAHSVTRLLEDIIRSRQYKTVAAFMPMRDEIALDIEAMSHICRLLIPRITDCDQLCQMEFYDYSPAAISPGAYGINEPQRGQACKPEDIDMVIVPGVAFTPDGKRLGRGKGFYDRYLARTGFRAQCIGVCFRHQLLQELPTEPHDHTMDIVITAEQ